jgi:hypothetical protein
METKEAFFVEARRSLAPLREAYGLVEDHAEFEGTPGEGGILVLRSPRLRARFILDRGPQVWLDFAAPSGDWFDVALLAEWLGQKAEAEAAVAAMPPADTPQPWPPLDARIKALADIGHRLLPGVLTLVDNRQWPKTAKALSVLRKSKFKESQARLRQQLGAAGVRGTIAPSARVSCALLTIGVLLLICAAVYILFR